MAHDIDADADLYEDEIDRGDTGVRIALTLLFTLVLAALEAVLAVVVIFELVWTFATREAPSPRVREFANRAIAYYYRIGRYLTYNESRVPFPFSDFPNVLEGDAWEPRDRESDLLAAKRPREEGR